MSYLGDTQKVAGHGPGQTALGGPAWAVGVDQMTSRGPCQSQPVSDSVTYQQCTGSHPLYSDPDPPMQPRRQFSCFSRAFSVLLSMSLLKPLLAFSILPSVYVPQCSQEFWFPGTQPGWAENPGHVTSLYSSFIQVHLVRSIECRQPYHLFLTHL